MRTRTFVVALTLTLLLALPAYAGGETSPQSLLDSVVEFVLDIFNGSDELASVEQSEGEGPPDEAGGYVTPAG